MELEAVDKTSPLKSCEYSLDAGNSQPIESETGSRIHRTNGFMCTWRGWGRANIYW